MKTLLAKTQLQNTSISNSALETCKLMLSEDAGHGERSRNPLHQSGGHGDGERLCGGKRRAVAEGFREKLKEGRDRITPCECDCHYPDQSIETNIYFTASQIRNILGNGGGLEEYVNIYLSAIIPFISFFCVCE